MRQFTTSEYYSVAGFLRDSNLSFGQLKPKWPRACRRDVFVFDQQRDGKLTLLSIDVSPKNGTFTICGNVGVRRLDRFARDTADDCGELVVEVSGHHLVVLAISLAHLDVDKQGFAWLPEDDFVGHFAADVDPVKARVMFAVQQPLTISALDDVMGVPAWKSLPSWFLVADGDQAIPPDAERLFAKRMGATTVEIATNHVAMVSHPEDVLHLIANAVDAVQPVR